MDDKSLKQLFPLGAGREEEGRRAVLIGADLRNADIRGVNLTGADLRAADLTDASLRSTEVWRCNLKGCAIEPQALHTLLDCRTV